MKNQLFGKNLYCWIKAVKVDIFILAFSIAIFIPFLFFVIPIEVGDGSEYYALSLAWKNTLRPFMTETSWTEYGRLVDSGQVMELQTVRDLKNTFPALSLGATADFPHFWFYSLCAAIVAEIGNIIGITIPTHASFLIVHCCFLATMLVIAWQCFRWRGLAATSMLTFLSPIIWYLDKVHTEFFTYCVTTSAVIFFLRKRYVAAAFFLALASTQNISFAAVSLFVLGFDAFFQRKENYSGSEVVVLVLTISTIALHPAYYFFRFGFLDPLLAGGTMVGANLQYAYIWFFDPDIGLFPNWPFGVALLVFSLIALRGYSLIRPITYCWLAFIVCYVSVSLVAQDSTTNLNSGATPGVARYALWYLGLFFPAALVVVERVISSKWFTVTAVLVMFGAVFSVAFFRPTLPEGHTRPSFASFWLQKYLPNVYNPPPEIFAERYGGVGEAVILGDALAVIGPDCHKTLLINQPLKDATTPILGGTSCGFDKDKLSLVIRHRLASNSWGKDTTPVYISLNDTEFQESRFVPILDNWYMTNTGSIIAGLMSNGWSVPEDWGTWSDGKQAALTFPCSAMESQAKAPIVIELEISPFVASAHPNVNISIYRDDDKAWSGVLDKPSVVRMELPIKTCESNSISTLKFIIDNPTSPASLGLSNDSRKLGIALLRIRFVALPKR